MKTAEFKHHTIPVINQRTINSTRDFSGYHLSYNPSAADYGTKTTAIVISNRVFFILCGDHKQALSAAADMGGLSACIQYLSIISAKRTHTANTSKLRVAQQTCLTWGQLYARR